MEECAFERGDLLEAKRQIDSMCHKLREAIKTLEEKQEPQRYKSQITLAKRRIKALEIADELIIKELNETGYENREAEQ